MSKVICEVCGTTYPETTTQCPICGCVRSGEGTPVIPTVSADNSDERTYTYVKGGRFSKANVKKRNRAMYAADPNSSSGDDMFENRANVDRGLTVTVIVLLLAIVAAVLYIVVNFFDVGIPAATKPNTPQTTGSSMSTQASNVQTEPSTEDTEEPTIPCQALKLDETVLTLDKPGAAVLLNVYAEPENTTDQMTFSSSDESVATVTESGKVVAVASGEAVITILCGDVQLQCTIICNIPLPTTEPPTEPSSEPASEFALNRSDFTLSSKGESWVLYNGAVGKTEITWTSDDESIATVDGGEVVAVGPGVTKVHAEYKGNVYSCIVRCSFTVENDPVVGGNGGVSEDGSAYVGPFTISHTDVTLKVDESFYLKLKDAADNNVAVTWVADDPSLCAIDGNKITGKTSGVAKVYTTYDGSEYSCIVRVTG